MPDNINNKTLTERQQLDLIAKMVDTIWTDKMTLQNTADLPFEQRSAVTFQQVKQPTEHILGVLDNIREVLTGKVGFISGPQFGS